MLFSAMGALAQTEPQHDAQKPMQHDMSMMDMDPYFTALNYPVPQDTMMVMLLSDFQSAWSANDFFTGMGMVQYGITHRWTVGFMAEGQKIFSLPTTYGGLRINSYFRVFQHNHLLNFTLYGEYEGLNGAARTLVEIPHWLRGSVKWVAPQYGMIMNGAITIPRPVTLLPETHCRE
jgi:hypothetical protein